MNNQAPVVWRQDDKPPNQDQFVQNIQNRTTALGCGPLVEFSTSELSRVLPDQWVLTVLRITERAEAPSFWKDPIERAIGTLRGANVRRALMWLPTENVEFREAVDTNLKRVETIRAGAAPQFDKRQVYDTITRSFRRGDYKRVGNNLAIPLTEFRRDEDSPPDSEEYWLVLGEHRDWLEALCAPLTSRPPPEDLIELLRPEADYEETPPTQDPRRECPVCLLYGPPGVGKSTIAEGLNSVFTHWTCRGRFQRVDCSTLGDTGLARIFGLGSAGFENAAGGTEGAAGRANGGTLLLDEWQAASPQVRAAILDLVQRGAYQPYGSADQFFTCCHIVLATTYNPQQLITDGLLPPALASRIGLRIYRVRSILESEQEDRLTRQDAFRTVCGSSRRWRRVLHSAQADLLKSVFLTERVLDWAGSKNWPANYRQMEHVAARYVQYLYDKGKPPEREDLDRWYAGDSWWCSAGVGSSRHSGHRSQGEHGEAEPHPCDLPRVRSALERAEDAAHAAGVNDADFADHLGYGMMTIHLLAHLLVSYPRAIANSEVQEQLGNFLPKEWTNHSQIVGPFRECKFVQIQGQGSGARWILATEARPAVGDVLREVLFLLPDQLRREVEHRLDPPGG